MAYDYGIGADKGTDTAPKSQGSAANNNESNVIKPNTVKSAGAESSVSAQLIFGNDLSVGKPFACEKPIVTFPGNPEFSISNEMLSKHLLLLGGIGCGKTNTFNFIIRQLEKNMSSDDTMIIFDTKGDFKKDFYRDANNQLLIGNGEEYKRISGHWNIFKELMPDGEYNKAVCDINAREMAKQLFAGYESQTQPFFSNAAIDILSKVLIYYMRHAPKSELNNESLVHFLKNADVKKYIDIMSYKEDPDFRSALSYFGDGSSDQSLGVFGTLQSMVSDLFIGIFASKGSDNNYEFSMRELVRKPCGAQIFIEYDLGVGEVLAPIYRVLFDQALKEALSRRSDGRSRGNVYFIIDEFKLLPKLMHIDDGLNFGRSLGVKICAGLQSISQLEQVYGQERAKVIASGFMNAFCFQTLDKPSRDYIKERFGVNYKNYSYYDENGKTQYISREGNVVEDWDVLNLDRGQAFIDINGKKPFKYTFPKYQGK